MFNILIAEDDVFISEHLKQILKDLNYSVQGVVSSFNGAITHLENHPTPDLALLDIRMHNEDQGIEIARHLKSIGVNFIFITSFSDKNTVQSAVELVPLGFIIKPFSKIEIKNVVAKALSELSDGFIEVKDASIVHRLKLEEICFIKSDNVYIEIHQKDKYIVQRNKLSDFMELLPKDLFARVHRSYIVNLNAIEARTSSSIEINGVQIPISKSYKDSVLS